MRLADKPWRWYVCKTTTTNKHAEAKPGRKCIAEAIQALLLSEREHAAELLRGVAGDLAASMSVQPLGEQASE